MPKIKKSTKSISKMKKAKISSKKKTIRITSKVAEKMSKKNTKIKTKKDNATEKYDVEGVIVIEDKKKTSDEFELGSDRNDLDNDDDFDLDFEADFDDGGD